MFIIIGDVTYTCPVVPLHKYKILDKENQAVKYNEEFYVKVLYLAD